VITKYEPTEITKQQFDEVLESNPEGEYEAYRPLGLFYGMEDCGDHQIWWAVDNADGNAWAEEFGTKEEAITWLRGESF